MWVVLDFFSQAFDVNVDSTGVTDVFIAPDMIQKLFSGEYLVWRRSKKIEKFQFFWRHVYLTAHISDCIIGQVDGEVRIADTFFAGGNSRLFYLETTQNSTDTGNQFFGIEWFDHIVVSTQFQSENFVKSLSLG